MSTSMQIGFSQRIQLDWLEQTAAMVLAGQTREQVETTLQERLHDKLSIGGTAQRGNREKAITILLKIWVSVPTWLQPFRDDGLEHRSSIYAACLFVGGRRINTCKLCTTAHRRRSNTFFRTPR